MNKYRQFFINFNYLNIRDHFKEIVYAVCPGAGGYDAACLIVQKVKLFLKS